MDPELLENAADHIRDLRADYLLDMDTTDMALIAQQHFLLALAALDTAVAHMRLACYDQRRIIALEQQAGKRW